ncbi:MAG: hypothetical protein M1815_005778 [Lichina confinis]|nr:MAG: hypothetical protein M1815_005778 [Lichina confinis]
MRYTWTTIVALLALLLLSYNVDAQSGYCNTKTSETRYLKIGDQVYAMRFQIPALRSSGRTVNKCIMNSGAKGNAVKTLQYSINNCYRPSRRLALDGDYGPRTKAAVRRVQRKIGTTADGIYGSRTLSLMKFYAAGLNAPGRRCIRYGTSA